MTRDLSKPRYARCDSCGRNQHKVAVRLDDRVVYDRQCSENERARRMRQKPAKVWPTVGYCPSCFNDYRERNLDFPTNGRVVYDLRARKPEREKALDTSAQSATVSSAMKSTDQEVTMSSDLHAVFATDGDGNTYRVSDPLSWNAAQDEWTRLDDLRREGRLPQAKFFEVRSVTVEGGELALSFARVRSHGRYDDAKFDLMFTKPVAVEHPKGFANATDAARAAWKLRFPTFTPRRNSWASGVQGYGGWYYYPNGTTAAQGLVDLSRVCKQRRLMVEGVNGRWYPVAVETL
jgi:hypothetical protein